MYHTDTHLISVLKSRMRHNLLYEDEEVGELIEAELDSSCSDDCVNVFYHS